MKLLFLLIIGICFLLVIYLKNKNNIESFLGNFDRPVIINRYVTIAVPNNNVYYSSPALINNALGIKKQN